MTEAELQGDGDHEELMASKEWSIQEIAWLLAIGFGTVWAATTIAGMVFGNHLKESMQNTLMKADGVAVIFIGIAGALSKMLEYLCKNCGRSFPRSCSLLPLAALPRASSTG